LDRRTAGRLGAHSTHARHDSRAITAAARRASYHDRFEKLVDPDLILEPAERAKRADHARRAWYLRLSERSREVRAARKAAAESEPPAE